MEREKKSIFVIYYFTVLIRKKWLRKLIEFISEIHQ